MPNVAEYTDEELFNIAGIQPEETTPIREKGLGYFGKLQRPDGSESTEISIGVDFDGKETEIPSLVPTLKQDEINYLLEGNRPTDEIVNKAIEHARGRMAGGKDPFAQEGEQVPDLSAVSDDALFEMAGIAPTEQPITEGIEKMELPFKDKVVSGLKRGVEPIGRAVEEVRGLAEAVPSAAVGMGAWLASFPVGAGEAISQLVGKGKLDFSEIQRVREEFQEGISKGTKFLSPKTYTGKKHLGGVAYPFEKFGEAKGLAGEWWGDKLCDPQDYGCKANIKGFVDLAGDVALLAVPESIKAIKEGRFREVLPKEKALEVEKAAIEAKPIVTKELDKAKVLEARVKQAEREIEADRKLLLERPEEYFAKREKPKPLAQQVKEEAQPLKEKMARDREIELLKRKVEEPEAFVKRKELEEAKPEVTEPKAEPFKLTTEEGRVAGEGKGAIQKGIFEKEAFVEKITEKEIKEKIPITEKKFDPEKDTLTAWVMKKGGINFQREHLKGELRRIAEQGKGRFLVSKTGKGKTLDQLVEAAKEDGFLREGESIREFLDILETDLTAKTIGRKVYSVQKADYFPDLTGEAGFLRIGKEKPPEIKFTGEAKKVWDMYEKAEATSKQKYSKTLQQTYRSLKRNVVDVSGNLKKSLIKKGKVGEEVVMRHDLIAGANTKAMRDYKLASDKVFEGLDEVGHKYLDGVIQSRRTIAIEKYKKIKHPEGLGAKEHQAAIDALPKAMKAELNKRADSYFKEMQNQLKQLKDEKIISKESYDALTEKGDYSPRRFLQHIDPESTYSIGGKKITVSDSGIKTLAEGSYGLLEKDSSLLLSEVISRTQARVFRNRANKALYDLAKTVPDNGVVKLAKVIKTTKEGKPVYQPTPTGFDKIKVIIDGQTKEILMPTEMAREWITKDPILTATQASIIRWASGSAILKPMATGLNPEFAMTNFPRDLAHIWITDYRQSYSPHLPIAMGQIAKDLVIVSKDAIKRKGRWVDYVNEGGGMEFLTHQGRITSKIRGSMRDIQTAMGYIGETSEIMPRLALRERALKQGYSPEKATWIARDYLDFSQGGSFIKAVDTGIPYLNASVQGTRGIFRAGAMKPAVFTYKVAQIGALATGLYYMNRFLNEDAWNQVSPRDKVNNFIITTPFSYKDKEGNKKYIVFKIAKDQGQRVMASIFEALAGKAIGDEMDFDQIAQSVQDVLPIIPSHNLPPTLDAFLGYAANKDFWRNEDIWRGSKYVKMQEQYTAYTHPAFIKIGELTGLSPDKLRYSLSQFFTYGNVYTSMGGFAWKQLLDEMPESERQKVTEEIILGQPFIRRLVARTDPFYKHAKEVEEEKIRSTTERYKLTREFDVLSQRFYDKEVAQKEISKFLMEAPREEKIRLRKRHSRLARMQEVPEKRWWLNLAGMPPEARANVYWNRWRNASSKDKEMLKKYSRQVPGVRTNRFIRQFNLLNSKEIEEKLKRK